MGKSTAASSPTNASQSLPIGASSPPAISKGRINNRYGRVGTMKCDHCRQSKRKCRYTDIEDICEACRARKIADCIKEPPGLRRRFRDLDYTVSSLGRGPPQFKLTPVEHSLNIQSTSNIWANPWTPYRQYSSVSNNLAQSIPILTRQYTYPPPFPESALWPGPAHNTSGLNDPMRTDIVLEEAESPTERIGTIPEDLSQGVILAENNHQAFAATGANYYPGLSKQSLTLSYGHGASSILKRNLSSVMEILGVWGDEVDIMMGFDVLPGDAHLAKEEDFDFFTARREIVWIEPQNLDIRHILNDNSEYVDTLAEIVRPFPVALFDVRARIVLCVHDAFWEEETPGSKEYLDPSIEPELMLPVFGKDFRPQVKGWTVLGGQESNSDGGDMKMGGQTPSQPREQSGSGSEEPSNSDDDRIQQSTPDSSHTDLTTAAGKQGKDKRDGTSYPPIVGIFIVEDPNGIRQKLKLLYEPWISVDGDCGTQATSIVQVVSPHIECVTPDKGGKPFLRAASIGLRIGTTKSSRPNPWNEQDFVPTFQKPECIDFEEEITRSREHQRGVRAIFTPSGGLSANFSVNEGVSVKRIKLAEIIDADNLDIGETDFTREHFWIYQIKSHVPRFINTISLPDHRSEAKINRNSPPTELAIEFEVIFEINPDSRPVNRLRRNYRAAPPRLNIGFNQVKISFFVAMHRVEPNSFVYYKCSDGKAPTETLIHKFPRPVLVIDERDFQMDKGNGTMRMSGMNPI